SERLFQDLLVQHEVRRHLLELPILLAELSELTDLRRAEIAKAFPPSVVRLLADAALPAELDHRHAAVAHPQDVHHLLGRELARPHRPISFRGWGPGGKPLYERFSGSGNGEKTRTAWEHAG